jgi:hypothetical protein
VNRPDQLDMQIAMEVIAIRKQVNEARRRLGIPARDYQDEPYHHRKEEP